MKAKMPAILLLLSAFHFTSLSAQQVSLDSFNTFMSGKWDYDSCRVPIFVFCTNLQSKSTVFSRIGHNQLYFQTYDSTGMTGADTTTPFLRNDSILWILPESYPDPFYNALSGTIPVQYPIRILDPNKFVVDLGSVKIFFRRDTAHANLCAATFNASAQITQPLSCLGANNAALQVSASGGTPAYYYQWSDGTSFSTITNLSNGTYKATVYDSNGCSASVSQNISASRRCPALPSLPVGPIPWPWLQP